jgi:hypothetical protein
VASMDDVIESKHDLSGRRSRCDLVSVGTKGRHGPRCGRAQLLVFGAMGSSLRRHDENPAASMTRGKWPHEKKASHLCL